MENYYTFVGMCNRSDLAITGREGFFKRIVALTGTDDPFYYAIDDHYGASDHEVFNDWGVQVPGIMMITWPDLYYHTSQDIADKCDATQFKRVCFIGAAAALTIANADEAMASKIAGEVAGNSSARIGKQLQRAIGEIDNAVKDNFESVYKKSRSYIEAAVVNEKATVASTNELTGGIPAWSTKYLAAIDATGKSVAAGFDTYAEMKAKSLGLNSIMFKPTPLEIKAKTIIPKPTAAVTAKGYRGFSEFVTNLKPEIRQQYPIAGRFTDTQELARLCNGTNNALDIKKLLDTQLRQGEVNLQDVINYISLLKEAGLVTL
jgi:hypothetical protein